ncbi:MAG TPA: SagB family peptide dehydrogenase [Pseudonocardiaceae bacterium]|nr:SagB family peptide dehydrogenase [Pseudonocardiaceae bacterium]
MDSLATAGTSAPVWAGTRRLVSFRDDVAVERQAGAVAIAHRWGTVVVRDPSRGLAAALHRLTFGPTRAANVVDLVATGADDPAAEVIRLHSLLNDLRFLLVHTVEVNSATVAEIVPMAVGARLGGLLGATTVPAGVRVRLSRFAYLRELDGAMSLENPLSLYRARLADPRLVALVAAAASSATVRELVDLACPGAVPAGRAVLDLLVGAGLLDVVEPDSTGPDETRRTRLRQWGFHDLLFHTRSRSGRHDEDFGATFRFIHDIEHERPVRELPDGPRVPLPVPDLDRVLATDARLTVALETRKSIRRPGERPIDADQLGEVLYRTARVRAVYGPDQAHQLPYQGVDRPYPACGGAGELDLWLTVSRCAGLAAGIYYYDPAGHQLVRVNTDRSDVDAMLGGASISAGNVAPPDVLVTITARFQRLGWQYSGMSYATTLKHVGVLYQTFYLVCTAMGLAPCGLGVGDIELSARCLGLDWEREGSVGEFMISGSPADEDRSRHAAQGLSGWREYNGGDWRRATEGPEENRP